MSVYIFRNVNIYWNCLRLMPNKIRPEVGQDKKEKLGTEQKRLQSVNTFVQFIELKERRGLVAL